MMDVRKTRPNGKIQGMTLPDKQTFEDCVCEAINAIVSENLGWCNMVEDTWFNRHQIGVVELNYGYPEGANRFRDDIHHKSTREVIYNLYPGADMLIKYAITVHVHSGLKKVATKLLGPGLKMGNPEIKGDFEVVDCRTLVGEGKENCRLLSLNCSDEFLEYLANQTKNHRYKLFGSRVFINGGKWIDSQSEYTTIKLPPEIAAAFLKSNKNQIMTYSANRIGLGRAMTEAQRCCLISQFTKLTYLTVFLFPYLTLGSVRARGPGKITGATTQSRRLQM